MSRPTRGAGGIFWGLILMAVGGVFLARNLGYEIPVWTGIARYWPALLIVWGLVKLVDYFLIRRSGEIRPLFSGGEVVLLIIVILAGTSLTAAANMSPDIGRLFEIANIDLWDVTGNNYDYAEHYEMDARAGSGIEIINRYGGVEVRPSDADRIVVDVKKTIVAADKPAADRMAEEFKYSIVEEGPGYRVISNFNRDDNSVRGRRFKTTLTVHVPKSSTVKVSNRNGRVSVVDLTGNQTIDNAFGDVEVLNISGSLELRNRNGSVTVDGIKDDARINNQFASTEAKNIQGVLDLDTRNGDVTVENVRQSVTIKNQFAATNVKNVGGDLDLNNRNGDVRVSVVTGNAKISNSFAAVEVEAIQGELRVTGNNNSVRVDRAEGSVSVQSSFQNVDISDAQGPVIVDSKNGDVAVSFSRAPQKDVSVTSQFSNITVSLPSSAGFTVEARTRFGSIDSDFRDLNARDENQEQSLVGRAGSGGPLLRLDGRNGNIRIQKKG